MFIKRSDKKKLFFTLELDSKVTSTSAQTTKVMSSTPVTHRTLYTLEETTSNRQSSTSTTEGPSKDGGKYEEKGQPQKTGNHTQESCIQYTVITIVIGDLRAFISLVSLQFGER